MFQDEARFGRISDVRRCWAPKPVRPLCQAMLIHEYTYAYAAVEAKSGVLDSLILPPSIPSACNCFSMRSVHATPTTRLSWCLMAPAGTPVGYSNHQRT